MEVDGGVVVVVWVVGDKVRDLDDSCVDGVVEIDVRDRIGRDVLCFVFYVGLDSVVYLSGGNGCLIIFRMNC